MSSDPLGPLMLLIAMLLAQGWISAAEEALRCMNEAKLHHDAEEGDELAGRLLSMMARQPQMLSTLRTCVTITNLLTGIFVSMRFSDRLAIRLQGAYPELGSRWAMLICVVGVTLCLAFVMLVLADQVPRRIAALEPERTAKRFFGAIRVLSAVLRPLTWLIEATSNGILKMLGVRPEDELEEVTEDDIRLMVDMGGETGAIEEGEKEMIENIFEFNNQSAEDVMTHRTDVAAIWADDDHDTIVKTILDTGLSRFPVYGEDMDDIVGILYTRDFLLNDHSKKPKTLRELLREAYFVPEHVQADTLFRDMQKRKVHMAIVVDEYGGMSGIVTMEDLLEEIVGNIYDEFDRQTEAEITQLAENLWRISGTAALEDVSEALNVELPTEEDYDTFGGLIFNQMTTIPDDGSQPEMDAAGLHIRVERLEDHRVETAIVSKIEEKPTEAEKETKE